MSSGISVPGGSQGLALLNLPTEWHSDGLCFRGYLLLQLDERSGRGYDQQLPGLNAEVGSGQLVAFDDVFTGFVKQPRYLGYIVFAGCPVIIAVIGKRHDRAQGQIGFVPCHSIGSNTCVLLKLQQGLFRALVKTVWRFRVIS